MHCALGLLCERGFVSVNGCWYNLYLTSDDHLWFQVEQVLLPLQSLSSPPVSLGSPYSIWQDHHCNLSK